MRFTYPAMFQHISEGPAKGGWFVRFPDLPGCATQAHGLADAQAYAVEAMTGWIEAGFELGHALGQPSDPAAMRVDDGFVQLVQSDEIDVEAAVAEGWARLAAENRRAM